MAKYLVDTDWAVFYLRGKEPYVSTLRKLRQEGLAISVISVGELYEGVFRAEDPQAREEGLGLLLDGVEITEVTKSIARTFGRLRADLRKQGLTVADLDLLIGSTAICYDLLLLTNNRRHYERIPHVKIAHSLCS